MLSWNVFYAKSASRTIRGYTYNIFGFFSLDGASLKVLFFSCVSFCFTIISCRFTYGSRLYGFWKRKKTHEWEVSSRVQTGSIEFRFMFIDGFRAKILISPELLAKATKHEALWSIILTPNILGTHKILIE